MDRDVPRATPLVLVHGNPENATVWNHLIAELDRDDAIALSPPGFGVPKSSRFQPSPDVYVSWLAERLEQFRAPVDLVGHDWGGIHVVGLAMRRPDLIRSWASDALGIFAPDYVWHARARTWQTPGAGERLAADIYAGDLATRLEVVTGLGMTGDAGVLIAGGMNATMGATVLALLRAAAQPVMSEAGRNLAAARAKPGLALVAGSDASNASGTVDQHVWAAREAGAQIAMMDTATHWWPTELPGPAARALRDFWAALDE